MLLVKPSSYHIVVPETSDKFMGVLDPLVPTKIYSPYNVYISCFKIMYSRYLLLKSSLDKTRLCSSNPKVVRISVPSLESSNEYSVRKSSMMDWRSVEVNTGTNFVGSEECSSLRVTACVSLSSF